VERLPREDRATRSLRQEEDLHGGGALKP